MIRILPPLSMAILPLSMASGAVAAPAPAMELPLHKPAMEIGYAPNQECELRVNKGAGTLLLEGFAHSDHPAAGSYELTVRQGSGSQVVQGGDFSAYPGEEEPLSTVSIGGSGDFSATLTIRWADGSEPCTKSIGDGGQWLPDVL